MRSFPSAHPYGSARRQRGSVLIAALVCLLIVSALLGSMLLAALQASRQIRKERDRRQCELLLQAGAERAAFRLAQQPEYAGETWNLPPDSIIGMGAGQVTIAVTRPAERPPQIDVVAEYPLDGERSIRRSRTLSTHPPTPPAQE
jgi:Tfp pilus assembly protein PilV